VAKLKFKTSQQPVKLWSITGYPLFPAMVGLWFGALFGLGILAIRLSLLEDLIIMSQLPLIVHAATPPLGMFARVLLALAMAALGTVLGMVLAFRLRKRRSPERETAREGSSGEVNRSENVQLLRTRDRHPDAPPRRPISAHEELGEAADAAQADFPGRRRSVAAMMTAAAHLSATDIADPHASADLPADPLSEPPDENSPRVLNLAEIGLNQQSGHISAALELDPFAEPPMPPRATVAGDRVEPVANPPFPVSTAVDPEQAAFHHAAPEQNMAPAYSTPLFASPAVVSSPIAERLSEVELTTAIDPVPAPKSERPERKSLARPLPQPGSDPTKRQIFRVPLSADLPLAPASVRKPVPEVGEDPVASVAQALATPPVPPAATAHSLRADHASAAQVEHGPSALAPDRLGQHERAAPDPLGMAQPLASLDSPLPSMTDQHQILQILEAGGPAVPLSDDSLSPPFAAPPLPGVLSGANPASVITTSLFDPVKPAGLFSSGASGSNFPPAPAAALIELDQALPVPQLDQTAPSPGPIVAKAPVDTAIHSAVAADPAALPTPILAGLDIAELDIAELDIAGLTERLRAAMHQRNHARRPASAMLSKTSPKAVAAPRMAISPIPTAQGFAPAEGAEVGVKPAPSPDPSIAGPDQAGGTFTADHPLPPVTPAKPAAVPLALRPLETEALDEVESDFLRSLLPPRRSELPADAADSSVITRPNPGALPTPASSAAESAPFAQPVWLVADELGGSAAEATGPAAEPVVIFPGQLARPLEPEARTAPVKIDEISALPAQEPGLSANPEETEQALRDALVKLQRMSGTA